MGELCVVGGPIQALLRYPSCNYRFGMSVPVLGSATLFGQRAMHGADQTNLKTIPVGVLSEIRSLSVVVDGGVVENRRPRLV